jgi:hypothetical protein
MSTYKLDGMILHTRKIIVNQRDFVSWANVWLFVQVLIAINALMWSVTQGLGISALVVALVITWAIWRVNKI